METGVTLASQFYEKLLASENAFKALSGLVSESPLNEAEWIEYKNGVFLEKVYEHWSKALSGFANSGGGIVIWGIQTKTKDGHDVPVDLALVQNPTALEGRLNALLSTAVDPPVLGVKIHSVVGPDDSGFVIAHIPASRLKPHEAKAPEIAGKYYLRVGHQQKPASQSLLRQLFYPNSSAVLDLKVEPFGGAPSQGFSVAVLVKNRGNASVQNVFVVVSSSLYFKSFEEGQRFTSTADLFNSPNVRNLATNDEMHPRLQFLICKMVLPSETTVAVSIFGRHFEPVKWQFKINDQQAAGRILIEGPFAVSNVD